jgi:hypothetical protein
MWVLSRRILTIQAYDMLFLSCFKEAFLSMQDIALMLCGETPNLIDNARQSRLPHARHIPISLSTIN